MRITRTSADSWKEHTLRLERALRDLLAAITDAGDTVEAILDGPGEGPVTRARAVLEGRQKEPR